MKKKERNVTIYDIAREAGVSTGTVSRYINGVGKSKGDTEERIRQAIEKLHYVPNRSARALKSQKRNILCLAYPESDNPFFFEMVSVIEDEVKKAGYSMMISHTHGEVQEELKILELTKEGIIDGLFLINFNYTDAHFAAFKSAGCPVVVSSLCVSPYGGQENDCYDYVGIDVFNALYMSTSHLIKNGHERIAYVGGPNTMCVFRERFEGYCSALSWGKLKLDENLVFAEEQFDEEAGYRAGCVIAKMEERPTAVCAASDVIAIGIIRALKEHGLRIPEDVALVGLDNISFDRVLTPPLSSVRMMQGEIGRCAVEFLLARLNGDESKAKKIIYQPELVVRQSSENAARPDAAAPET
ncbi:MAG: LacI family DNA-binding transcriptional regulator [Eubacteriales bacterium]|nr:LacI family DNA-binding transcriptional regulator [Eubacteriales bacterium]